MSNLYGRPDTLVLTFKARQTSTGPIIAKIISVLIPENASITLIIYLLGFEHYPIEILVVLSLLGAPYDIESTIIEAFEADDIAHEEG